MSAPSGPRGTSTSGGSSSGGGGNRPETLEELFGFYYTSFKPMYSGICADNAPPLELALEVVAAFDHLARHWRPADLGSSEEEKRTVDRVAGHLKRGLFDVFKIILKNTRDNYDRLAKTETSAINNGEFDRDCLEVWHKIRTGAAHARSCEGNAIDDWHRAFEEWNQVTKDCVSFDENFTYNTAVNWARRRT